MIPSRRLAIGLLLAFEPSTFITLPLHHKDTRPSDPPGASVSAGGRFVAFVSAARLVPADTDDENDIYVFDRGSGAVSLESADVTALTGGTPLISATGRFLVYEEAADPASPALQVLMLRDRTTGVVRPIQRGHERPNGSSRNAAISGDERFVAFASSATNLTDEPDANRAAEDVYVGDLATMSFRRVSVDASGVQAAIGSSFSPAISDDGRFVAFSSTAPLNAGARHGNARGVNVYRWDGKTGTTSRVSIAVGGDADGPSYNAAISGDGRDVAFVSDATNLTRRRDRNALPDIYLRDMIDNVTARITSSPAGDAANGASDRPALSGDGRIVVFQSDASNLTCAEHCPLADRDINLVTDIFRHDRRTGITERISRGRTPWMEPSIGPAMDRAGTTIAFSSRHPVDRSDDRHDYDLFVWAVTPSVTAPDRQAARDRASRTSTASGRR